MKRTIYATPQDAEAAFYESIERSDLETMMTVWADDDDIVCVHPGAARASGVAQVRESWRQIFAGGQALRFRLRHPQTVNGMTLVVHSVYEQISIAGEARTHGPVVATNVYMRTENGWRMVVHHASAAPSSPDPESKRAPKTLH
ncbi:MAG TPA: nuclear transport factor 2 family protein [Burkholderiales bacterium]|jgi:ketosteroid isomerase-like protein|nr:nuclear transport factor 2 family protein [Burkholderiales bacterium]